MFIRVSAGIVSVFCRTCVCVSLDEKKEKKTKLKARSQLQTTTNVFCECKRDFRIEGKDYRHNFSVNCR